MLQTYISYPIPRTSDFSKEPVFFLLENGISDPDMALGELSAPGILFLGLINWLSKETCEHIYLYTYTYLEDL